MVKYYMVRTRDDVEKFVQKGVSAVGWSDVDFSSFQDVEELCNRVREECYDGETSSIIGRKIGEVRRFRNIKAGDVILVPCYKGFYIGVATGDFIYDTSPEVYEKDLSNQIKIDFVKRSGRPAFFARDGKLTALSSKLSVRGFTVLSITEEPIIETVKQLMGSGSDISFRDIVAEKENLKANEFRNALMDSLSNYSQISLNAGGRGFEELIAALMKKDGFETRILPKTVGGSSVADADVLAIKKSSLGDEFTTAYYIQVKHYSGQSDGGIDQIIEFKKSMEKMELEYGLISIKHTSSDNSQFEEITLNSNQIKYVLISSGEFTESVKDLACSQDIQLIDGKRLSEILFEAIDDIPVEYRYQLGFVKQYEHI